MNNGNSDNNALGDDDELNQPAEHGDDHRRTQIFAYILEIF